LANKKFIQTLSKNKILILKASGAVSVVFIFVLLSLFDQVKLVSGRRSLVCDVRGQAVAPEHLNLQDRTL
jgi:hypothetical protein